MCAYSLDHITPSRLGIIVVANINDISNVRDLKDPRLSLFDTFVEFISNALHPKFSKNTAPASAPGRFKSLCALSTFRVVGLGGLEPPASPLSGVRSNHLSYRPKSRPQWWSLSGSNRRPPACKAGALPAELWPQMGSTLNAGHLCGRLDKQLAVFSL